jgi:hypothetical protein
MNTSPSEVPDALTEIERRMVAAAKARESATQVAQPGDDPATSRAS